MSSCSFNRASARSSSGRKVVAMSFLPNFTYTLCRNGEIERDGGDEGINHSKLSVGGTGCQVRALQQ